MRSEADGKPVTARLLARGPRTCQLRMRSFAELALKFSIARPRPNPIRHREHEWWLLTPKALANPGLKSIPPPLSGDSARSRRYGNDDRCHLSSVVDEMPSSVQIGHVYWSLLRPLVPNCRPHRRKNDPG